MKIFTTNTNMQSMQYNAMQCNAMQCNAMRCDAMQCNSMQCNVMQCNARVASRTTFSLPLIRTNDGMFNIRFFGPKIWNTIDESLKSLSINSFKNKLKKTGNWPLLASNLYIS